MERKINIMVVEDEMIIAAKISMYLTELGYEVTGIFPRGEEALVVIEEKQPDILLLDINLKGRLDGVETAQAMQEKFDVPIVYLTANADEANFKRAKSTRPYAFISKPFKKLDLQRALELVISRLAMDAPAGNEPAAEKSPFILRDRIFIMHKDRMVKVLLEDILYIEAERNYSHLFTADKDYLLTVPLKSFEDKMTDAPFLRVHRSYIVNLTKIDELNDNHLIIGAHVIPISRSYKDRLLERLTTL